VVVKTVRHVSDMYTVVTQYLDSWFRVWRKDRC